MGATVDRVVVVSAKVYFPISPSTVKESKISETEKLLW